MVSRVYVVGMGMGSMRLLSMAAREAIEKSELVVGSPRLLEGLGACAARTVALVATDAIVEELELAPECTASVLMSGDVGFYSGARALVRRLCHLDVEMIPGISSLAYLCARLRMAWDDVHVVSAHGRPHNAVGAIQAHRKTFVLLGGASTPSALCTQLVERGLGDAVVHVGERLSYPEERIACGLASDLVGTEFDGLSVMLVENPRAIATDVAAPHVGDDAFVRGTTPMTKEEIRALALCKLRVHPSSVVWDVGAGTGSVSVEAALLAREGLVLAVERDAQACSLVERNREAFGLPNVRVVQGVAPQALAGLPAPDRVFVGGSGGHLADIVGAALRANPRVRLCVVAISLETLCEALSCLRTSDVENVDIVQLLVARARKAGSHNLMMGGNPVYVISADGSGACATMHGDGGEA